jgi:hypothetical protein
MPQKSGLIGNERREQRGPDVPLVFLQRDHRAPNYRHAASLVSLRSATTSAKCT